MRPDDRVRLQHMLDAAQTAMAFAQQASRAELETDELRAHGLVRLIHGYYDIGLDRVWDTLTHDLPPMAAALERWLAAHQ